MGSGPNKSKRRDLVVGGLRLAGLNICKKCGRPAEKPSDVCADFPRCKQVRSSRLVGRAVLGRRPGD